MRTPILLTHDMKKLVKQLHFSTDQLSGLGYNTRVAMFTYGICQKDLLRPEDATDACSQKQHISMSHKVAYVLPEKATTTACGQRPQGFLRENSQLKPGKQSALTNTRLRTKAANMGYLYIFVE